MEAATEHRERYQVALHNSAGNPITTTEELLEHRITLLRVTIETILQIGLTDLPDMTRDRLTAALERDDRLVALTTPEDTEEHDVHVQDQ